MVLKTKNCKKDNHNRRYKKSSIMVVFWLNVSIRLFPHDFGTLSFYVFVFSVILADIWLIFCILRAKNNSEKRRVNSEKYKIAFLAYDFFRRHTIHYSLFTFNFAEGNFGCLDVSPIFIYNYYLEVRRWRRRWLQLEAKLLLRE